MTLEEELPRLFEELAADHVVGSPPRLDAGDSFERQRSPQRPRILVGLAAAAIVGVLVGGLVILSGRGERGQDEPANATASAADGSLEPVATLPDMDDLDPTAVTVAGTGDPEPVDASSSDDNAGRCDAITESIVAEAGGWSLIGVNDLPEVDVCIYVLDSGQLSVRFRDGDRATDVSTGWVGLDDLVTSAKAEGSAVVELGIGDESYLIDDTTAGAQTADGTVVISVQNGTVRIDEASATTLLTAAVEALG